MPALQYCEFVKALFDRKCLLDHSGKLAPARGSLPTILSLLIVLAIPAAAKAQDTVTGAFEGIVSDSQTGAALKGALVEIINQQTSVAITLHTDYRGRFYQGLLIPGVYRIRVSTAGYQTREVLQRLKITYTGLRSNPKIICC